MTIRCREANKSEKGSAADPAQKLVIQWTSQI